MNKSSNSPLDEKAIGRRLREFRESKGIIRTSLGLMLGVPTDRLVSYEMGRVPLRFGVYRKLAEKFFVHPVWLATGTGSQTFAKDFAVKLSMQPPDHLPFSEVYKVYLLPYLENQSAVAEQMMLTLTRLSTEMISQYRTSKIVTPETYQGALEVHSELLRIAREVEQKTKRRK